MRQKDVLFICVHNSGRSQLAEELLRKHADGLLTVESAGFEPGEINPLVAEVLLEDGIDIGGKKTQKVFDLFKQSRSFRYVITVCEESEEGNCPIFPGMTHRLHLPFPDPSRLTGSREEKLEKIRHIRDAIRAMVQDFIAWVQSGEEARLGDKWHVFNQAARPEK